MTLHYISFHCVSLDRVTFHDTTSFTLTFILTFALTYIILHCTTLNDSMLSLHWHVHYITHYIAVHYIILHHIAGQCCAVPYITLHRTYMIHTFVHNTYIRTCIPWLQPHCQSMLPASRTLAYRPTLLPVLSSPQANPSHLETVPGSAQGGSPRGSKPREDVFLVVII